MRFLVIGLVLLFPLTAFAQVRGISKKGGALDQKGSGVQYALLVGNNEYRHWPDLKTAIRDVEGVRDVLLSRYGFSERNVSLLRDATRRQMLQGFDRLRELSRPQDKVFIYYAGHVVYDEKQDGYWVPVDGQQDNNYDYISNADVLNRLGSIDARHKLLISDSCFSGNLLTRGMSLPDETELRKPGFYRQKNRLNSVQGFTSGGNEPVYDGGPQWKGNSVFAYHLIAQLEANQQPYLSASDLGMRVARHVANDTLTLMGASQTPLLQQIGNQGDQGGEFFFLRPKRRKRSVLALFRIPDRGVLRENGEGARQVIEGQFEQMTRLVPNLNWRRDVIPGSLSTQELAGLMRKRNIDTALVWTINGKVVEQPSLMWQGMAYMDLYLWLYVLEDEKALMRDRFILSGERLPVRDLDMSDAELRRHFRDLADKVVRHWEENGSARFVRGIFE